jgi:hypothetical protein
MNCKHCDKLCKSNHSLNNHERLCKSNPHRQTISNKPWEAAAAAKSKCQHCTIEYTNSNIKKHEAACKSNHANHKLCPVCNTTHTGGGVTCSYACSNTHFRTGKNHPNYNKSGKSYRAICFEYHKKECLVCGEDKMVAVHHVNEDHTDNDPSNLVPMCPTHHQYMHSRYKDEYKSLVEQYIINFKNSC